MPPPWDLYLVQVRCHELWPWRPCSHRQIPWTPWRLRVPGLVATAWMVRLVRLMGGAGIGGGVFWLNCFFFWGGGWLVTLEWLVGFVDMFWGFCVGVVLASWDFVVLVWETLLMMGSPQAASPLSSCSRVTPFDLCSWCIGCSLLR